MVTTCASSLTARRAREKHTPWKEEWMLNQRAWFLGLSSRFSRQHGNSKKEDGRFVSFRCGHWSWIIIIILFLFSSPPTWVCMYACMCTYMHVFLLAVVFETAVVTLNCYCQNQRECDWVNFLNFKFAVKLGLLRVVGCSRFDNTFFCWRSMYVCMHSDVMDLNIVTWSWKALGSQLHTLHNFLNLPFKFKI